MRTRERGVPITDDLVKALEREWEEGRKRAPNPRRKVVRRAKATSPTDQRKGRSGLGSEPRPYRRGIMYSKGGRLERARELLLSGAGIREVQRTTGMATQTVRKLHRRLLEDRGPFPCRCGRVSGHKGYCDARRESNRMHSTSIGATDGTE